MTYTTQQQLKILIQLKLLQSIRNHINQKYYTPLTRQKYKEYHSQAVRHVQLTHTELYDELYDTQSQTVRKQK